MRTGRDKVIACPKCSAPARVFTLVSSNTSGPSDGPMAICSPPCVRCRRPSPAATAARRSTASPMRPRPARSISCLPMRMLHANRDVGPGPRGGRRAFADWRPLNTWRLSRPARPIPSSASMNCVGSPGGATMMPSAACRTPLAAAVWRGWGSGAKRTRQPRPHGACEWRQPRT